MGGASPPQRTFSGSAGKYGGNDKVTHVALSHSPLVGKKWAEITESALLKPGAYNACSHSQARILPAIP